MLEWCNPARFNEILSVNDFIVLQIDTDQGEHPTFGVPLTENGQDRSAAVLVADVKALIASKLGASWPQFAERILFAIAVHSLECRILPLHAKFPADLERIKNCASHLIRLAGLKSETDLKTYRTFEALIAPMQKSRKNKQWQENLKKCRDNNHSLAVFLDALPI